MQHVSDKPESSSRLVRHGCTTLDLYKAGRVVSMNGDLVFSSIFRGDFEEESEVVLGTTSINILSDVITDNGVAQNWWNVVLSKGTESRLSYLRVKSRAAFDIDVFIMILV